MKIFLLGKGRVGTAFSKHLKKKKVPFTHCRNADFSNRTGILFAAVNDDAALMILKSAREKNPELYIIHFSASVKFDDELTFLFHPYSSISGNTDLSKITFTLWGGKNKEIETVLKKAGFRFIKTEKSPSLLYHISAVVSGNFTQFFFLNALKMLENEGFSRSESQKLVQQLIRSSIENVLNHDLLGITGPAARGDNDAIEKETAHLIMYNRDFSAIFRNINMLIQKAVKDDFLFK